MFNPTDAADDNDGFADVAEVFMSTDTLDACSDSTSDDADPMDNTVDKNANILDVLKYKGKIPSEATGSLRRLDLNADGNVNVLDVLIYKGKIPSSCT